MRIRHHLVTAVLMTVATTLLLGVVYPLVVTALAQVMFPRQANGQLVERGGRVVGSAIIGQGFTGAAYFHPRPSATATPYDAANSGGSQYGPTNRKLVDAVATRVKELQAENPGTPVPIELVTTSASGFDPHISPAGAAFQLARVARERHVSVDALRALVARHTEGRTLGFLGEPRVNVLLLNLAIDDAFPRRP